MASGSSILSHLDALIGDTNTDKLSDRNGFADWTALQLVPSSQIGIDVGNVNLEEESLEDLTISQYATASSPRLLHNETSPWDLVKDPLWNSIDRSIWEALLRALYSKTSSEDVAGEIAEIIGYERIDLVSEILARRTDFAKEIDQRLHGIFALSQTGSRDHVSAAQMFEDSKSRMVAALHANASRSVFDGLAEAAPQAEVLPHVYTSQMLSHPGGSILSQFGTKYTLPLGTTRHLHQEYEEFIVPPPTTVPPRISERPILIGELEPLARECFSAYTSLNRIQSIVYPVAYKTNENMLVCAPTGAGKTDVALLSILHVIDQYRDPTVQNLRDSIRRNDFKIIYVAPMKALASEITRKFGKRLRGLGISVRELTGDMQMTKAEIAATQVIVTTPEKWDVVTRKPTGEGELASSIKLLILDEIHLLNEERGAVLEIIVARTLRQVESSQSIVRIVGLSATLPNYVDVAQFLSVSLQKGLFYFDGSFRPVPLEQHFLGIKGKPGSALSKKNMDHVTFKKVLELVEQGHQVMVFVHARKETVKTAMTLREMAIADGSSELFMCDEHPQWANFRKEVGGSRNKEMKFLFDNGFGIHHAGMLRSDRNNIERLFEARAIKVLCCTATLAWGVNLPAHAAVIKGTQIYDSSKGAFTDLSVLDVLQIFGRAGRPGLETSGEGYIFTTDDKLHHYLEAVISSVPIESRFQGGMIDALNAEVSLGTVANRADAVQWLGYTYLYVRMRKNPFLYGIDRDSLVDDPGLGNKRKELVEIAARKLAETKMIIFDQGTGSLQNTDLGRIAAKYYIRAASIEIFNKGFKPKMTEADVLALLSMSTEFDQIQLRESEMDELEALMKTLPCEVKGGTSASAGKVNILLQTYISRWEGLQDFALVSDMAYVAQNSGRIIRALLEISMSKKWANVTSTLVGLSKAIEKRLWPYDHPLEQSQLKFETLNALRRWADEWPIEEIANTDPEVVGNVVHLNKFQGAAIVEAAKRFPFAGITYQLQPLASDVLKISLTIKRQFTWNAKLHGTSEAFWVWIEDEEGLNIHQLAHLAFHQDTGSLDQNFILPISNDDMPNTLVVRWVSDYWIGAEQQVPISLQGLVMPPKPQCHSALLELPFLPISGILDPHVASAHEKEINVLNSIQTQSFWSFMHTKQHALLCAPGGCGKTVLADILLQSYLVNERSSWIILVAPRRNIAQALYANLRAASRHLSLNVESPRAETLLHRKAGSIYVTHATTLLSALSARNSSSQIKDLDVVVCDHLEQLDSTYELAVSILRLETQSSPTRYIGFSDSLNDPSDLAAWLNVEPTALFSFRPRDREQSLQLHTHPFTIPHSAALFKAMARPAHKAIATALSTGSAIVFVPSRGQCRSIALDLITQCALDSETASGYLAKDISEDTTQLYRDQLQNQDLGDFLVKGVGFYHHGIDKNDRNLILRLYVEGVIRILLVPQDACWDLPVRSSVVVVLGTQYVEIQPESNARRVRDYSLIDIVRMQSLAISHSGTGHFHLFCQSESLDTYLRFLNEGLPLESQIPESQDLPVWVRKLNSKGRILNKQDIFDLLSFTFLARRLSSNPTFYGLQSSSGNESLSRIVDKVLEDIQADSG